MKAAIIIPTQSNIKSSLQNLLKVYESLQERQGIDVTIFTDKKNDFAYKSIKVEKISGLDYRTPIEKGLFVLGLPRFYYTDLIEKLKGYDVIESSNPEFYLFAYQSYLAAKKYGSRLIYRTSQTVEGFFMFKATKPLSLHFAKRACNYAAHLLFTNPQAEQRYIKLGLLDKTKNPKKSVIIGHATDTKCFRPRKVAMPKKRVIVSVGGLYKIKGHHVIMQAAKKLMDQNYDIELWIVGDGYYKKSLELLADELGVHSRVKFLGAKGHEELASIYNKASVFALANYQEITPAVNEALACKIPVVVMECGGCNFIIKNGHSGIITKRFDVDDLARGMKKMLDHKNFAENLAKNGRKHILDNFSIEKVAEKFYRCFKD